MGHCSSAGALHCCAVLLSEIIILLTLGLTAGALGGMLGIGGSVIMIPVLTIVLRRDIHLAQAIAMIINVCVAVPAMIQHHRAGAVRWLIVGRMLVPATVMILIGVEVANHIDSTRMQQVFGVFLIYVVVDNVIRVIRRRNEPTHDQARDDWLRVGLVGGFMGFWAGLLGVGGGIVAVPLLQKVCRLPLRQCIATTAACMCVSAAFGAVRKNLALDDLGQEVSQSVLTAVYLAPTAVLGGMLGGWLTHALPLNVVRVAFILLMAWSAGELLGLI